MKSNPFETIAYWLGTQKMTSSEKREMRDVLVAYATTHPVRSGLVSPYMFKYMGVALASLVLVLGTSAGITSASMKALPNQSLYGVKLWVEEFQAKTQETPSARIAFETNRIKTRFDEATTLAVRHELDESSSQMIQAGLEHSREAVLATTEQLQESDPEMALKALGALETSFSSNGKILATIETNTNQDIGTIVLAAQQTTQSLALEKVRFEKILSLQPNSDSKTKTEEKLQAIAAKIKDSPAPAALIPDAITASSATAPVTVPPLTPEKAEPTVDDLVAGAKEKISQGSYSEALVTLQKAEQVIDEAALTKKLEETYNVKTSTQ